MSTLSDFGLLLDKLRGTNSVSEKVAILREVPYGSIHILVRCALDDTNYYVTSDNLKKHSDLVGVCCDDIFGLLDKLRIREVTGNEAIKLCNGFCNGLSDLERNAFYCIIDKDLACGVNAKVANKACSGWVPTFNVALADKWSGEKFDSNWVISRKLDGVRCVCIISSADDIKFYSRQGKEFDTLGVLRNEISQLVIAGLLPTGIVLDGELCLMRDGVEDFQSIMKEVRRKDWTIENPMYKLFDILSIEEFYGLNKSKGYKERIKKASSIGTHKHISVVEHCEYSEDTFSKWQERVVNEGWEGLMARKDVPYEGKRSKNLLKIKSFNDAEYVVDGVDTDGEATLVINGLAKQVPAIRCLLIKHKGNVVGVGSGLTPEQRVDFLAHPEKIVGKTITVKYFSESTDKDGNISLRFPVVKVIYENNRDC